MAAAIYLILGVITFIYLIFDLVLNWELARKNAGRYLVWPLATLWLVVGSVAWPVMWFVLAMRFIRKVTAQREPNG